MDVGGDLPCGCSQKGRNLVVCIDGTSNQFGTNNTNVVELYSQIIKSKDQLTYYNSGIGTYAKPSWKSWRYLRQVVDNTIDLAIAWNFEKIVLRAYRWLSDNYEEGDRIYLFGFSRGAYQVRTLAGMIAKVGLIHKGNEEQIPFAFELYATQDEEKDQRTFLDKQLGTQVKSNTPPGPLAQQPKPTVTRQASYDMISPFFDFYRRPMSTSEGVNGKDMKPQKAATVQNLAAQFKLTFSHSNARVHFLGVWDTVSSVGIVRGKSYPLTDSAEHICYFRHALALDERRVKFLPEYVLGGASVESNKIPMRGTLPRVKEVWFAGTHSDIGGGNQPNINLDLAAIPFLWMASEALSSQLQLRASTNVSWSRDKMGHVKESLQWFWRPFEYSLIKRLSYQDSNSTTIRLHRGRGRKVKPGQKIHSSVVFCPKDYVPKAKLPSSTHQWTEIVANESAFMANSASWLQLIEKDIFDSDAIREIVHNLMASHANEASLLYRLRAAEASIDGKKVLLEDPNLMEKLLHISISREGEVRSNLLDILQDLLEYQAMDLLLKVGDIHTNQDRDSPVRFKLLAQIMSLVASPGNTWKNEQYIRQGSAISIILACIDDEKINEMILDPQSILWEHRHHDAAPRSYSRTAAIDILTSIIPKVEIVDVLAPWHTVLLEGDDELKLVTLEFLKAVAVKGDPGRDILTTAVVTQLYDLLLSKAARPMVAKFFTETLTVCHEVNHETLFASETVVIFRQWLSESGSRNLAFDFFQTALSSIDALQNMIFDSATIHVLTNLDIILGYDSGDTQYPIENVARFFAPVKFLNTVTTHKVLRDKILPLVCGQIATRLHEDATSIPCLCFLTVALQSSPRPRELGCVAGAAFLQTDVILQAVRKLLNGSNHPDISSKVRGVFIAVARTSLDHLHRQMFDADVVSVILQSDDHRVVFDLFVAAASWAGDLQKILFTAENIPELWKALPFVDQRPSEYSREAWRRFVEEDHFRTLIFDDPSIENLQQLIQGGKALSDAIIDILGIVAADESLQSRILDAETNLALRERCAIEMLSQGSTLGVSHEAIFEFLETAIQYENLRTTLFDITIVSALWLHLGVTEFKELQSYHGYSCDDHCRTAVLNIFAEAAAHGVLQDHWIYGPSNTSILESRFKNSPPQQSINLFRRNIDTEDLQSGIFPKIQVSMLVDMLWHRSEDVRQAGISFFAAVARARENVRDCIFTPQIVECIRESINALSQWRREEQVQQIFRALSHDDNTMEIFFRPNGIVEELSRNSISVDSPNFWRTVNSVATFLPHPKYQAMFFPLIDPYVPHLEDTTTNMETWNDPGANRALRRFFLPWFLHRPASVDHHGYDIINFFTWMEFDHVTALRVFEAAQNPIELGLAPAAHFPQSEDKSLSSRICNLEAACQIWESLPSTPAHARSAVTKYFESQGRVQLLRDGLIVHTLLRNLTSGAPGVGAKLHAELLEAVKSDEFHDRFCCIQLRDHFKCPRSHGEIDPVETEELKPKRRGWLSRILQRRWVHFGGI